MKHEIKTHELKILPEHFVSVVDQSKKAEFRLNDRGYKWRDIMRLREWQNGDYTGREIYVTITDVTDVTPYINTANNELHHGNIFVMLSFSIIPGSLCNIPYLR